jgi:putative tryptophan/tyrosine transport system substrate-binding protein
MRRREFVALVGGMATWPLGVRAQQPAKVPRIGVLWHAANAEQEGTNYKAVVKGFADIGYIDGKTVVLEHRFPNEQPAQFRSMAAELVASGVDVLVVIGANAPPYAKEATKTIPIVFALMPDPIGSKLVNNLARPEANVTGLSNSASDIVGKRLALFKEIIPGLSRVAFLVNSNLPSQPAMSRCFRRQPPTLGFQERCSYGERRTN